MEHYCIYCGHDDSNHFENCPLKAGVPKGVLGFYPKQDDLEYNLSLGRMSILMTIYPHGLGPSDDKIRKKLEYESMSFNVRRFNMRWLNNQNKLKKPIIKKYYQKKYKKEFENLKKAAKTYGLNDKEFQEILNEKVLLSNYSSKEMLPFYRNLKTGRLIYLEVK